MEVLQNSNIWATDLQAGSKPAVQTGITNQEEHHEPDRTSSQKIDWGIQAENR